MSKENSSHPLKVVPVSRTKASQFGSLGSSSKTGNETKRKKPPTSISKATEK